MADGTRSAKSRPHKKSTRSAIHRDTGKYKRQAIRTAANKARRAAGDTCKMRRIALRRKIREMGGKLYNIKIK